jgi:protease-4
MPKIRLCYYVEEKFRLIGTLKYMFGKDNNIKDDMAQDMLEKLVLENLKETRKRRRWGIFFKFIFLAYFVALLFIYFSPFKSNDSSLDKPYAAVINIHGVISADSDANSKSIISSLKQAFKDKKAKAVILDINSPGGSPVESDAIFQEIRYLEKENPDLKVYALCGDVCASGGYYIASATDKIYASKMSLVGSIGVVAGGFGFVDAMKKVGVERRLYTAGDNKGFLDSFSEQNLNQVADMEKMLGGLHNVFIDAVKEGRGDRLNLKEEKLIFSGMPFDGIQGKSLGLVDDYATMQSLLREIGVEDTVNYTVKKSVLEKLSDRMSMQINNKI